jgi:hypothetical protein
MPRGHEANRTPAAAIGLFPASIATGIGSETQQPLAQVVVGTARRARAYAEAGVDAVWLAGGVTREGVSGVHAAVQLPLLLGGGDGDLTDDFLTANPKFLPQKSKYPIDLSKVF